MGISTGKKSPARYLRNLNCLALSVIYGGKSDNQRARNDVLDLFHCHCFVCVGLLWGRIKLFQV